MAPTSRKRSTKPDQPHRPRVFLFGHELDPTPPRQGTGSAVLLDRETGVPDVVHLHLAPSTAPGSRRHLIPLRWRFGPTEDGGSGGPIPAKAGAWLRIDDSKTPVRARCRIRVDPDSEILDTDVQVVETGPTSFTRNAPVLETDALSGKSVLCVGLGSGGAAIVDLLARSGVGRFVLWDHDRLESHNVARHVCTLRDIGRQKVRAVREHILSINPAARVVTVNKDVTEADDELAEHVEGVDCVVAGTDNNVSRFVINEAAVLASRPAYYGRAYPRACGGDVIQVLPDPDMPCYACHAEDRIVDEEISSARDADRVAYADRAVPIEPGLTVDIQPIANMIARLVVLRLCVGTRSSLVETAEELDAPLYLWVNQRRGNFAGWQPMKREYKRMSILRWYAINVPKNPECMTCQTLNGD